MKQCSLQNVCNRSSQLSTYRAIKQLKQLVTGLSSSHGKGLGSILASPSVIYGG